jgi:hypothetical protein
MRTRPIRTPQETANCVCYIPCEWGRNCVADISRPWAVKHRQHLGGGHLKKSKYAQLSFEENHRIVRKKAKVLEIETNSVYRKFMDLAYMSCLQNPSAEISPICYPSVSKELSK